MINSVSMIMQVDRSLMLRHYLQESIFRSLMKISNLHLIPTLKKSCKSNIAISPLSESQQSDQSQTFIAAGQLDDQSMDEHSDDSSINEDKNGVLGDLNVA